MPKWRSRSLSWRPRMTSIRGRWRCWKRREQAWRPITPLWVRRRCLWIDTFMLKHLHWHLFLSARGKLWLSLEMDPFSFLLLFIFFCWEPQPQKELGWQQTGLHQTRCRPGHRRHPGGAGGSTPSGSGPPPDIVYKPVLFKNKFHRRSWATT